MKDLKKILRHKPETRRTINEISSFIGSEKSAEMLDQIAELKNRTIEIISEKLNDPKYDHWYFYDAGCSYNSEIITICHRYRINYINNLEEKRHADLGGPF